MNQPIGNHWIDRHTQHRSTTSDPRGTCATCNRDNVTGNHVRCPRCWTFITADGHHCAKEN